MVALLVAMALLGSGCIYGPMALQHRDEDPTTRPWWCHSMHGHDDHTDPHYDGMMKGMLSWDDCIQASAHFDLALDYALQYPTRGAAEAAGFHRTVNYVAGMGTHHADMGDFGLDDLLSPDFDPHNPVFPGSPLDDVFDPNRPEFLQYAGNTANAPLVGMSWYVRTDDGEPPDGFVGDNDWWHVHERLCFSRSNFLVIGEDLSDNQCANRNGINLHLDDYWMVHAWIVPGYEHHPDVFIGHHPCLVAGGPLPADDPCWHEGHHM